MRNLLCWLFGHRWGGWVYEDTQPTMTDQCVRCGEIRYKTVMPDGQFAGWNK